MSNPKQEQIEITERLQLKWLKRMEEQLDNGEITATEMSTLAGLLMRNGWNLDPSALPQSLLDKLNIKPDISFEDDEPGDEEMFGGGVSIAR